MNRFWLWLLAYGLALLALVVFAKQIIGPAHAHEWYTTARDPVSGASCCGGHDCAPVPLDADWVTPVADGFRVTMTLEQSRQINPYSQAPVDAVVPWNRVQAPPPDATEPVLYYVCISATARATRGGIYCLFARLGT